MKPVKVTKKIKQTKLQGNSKMFSAYTIDQLNNGKILASSRQNSEAPNVKVESNETGFYIEQ